MKTHKKWYLIGGISLVVVLVLSVALGIALSGGDEERDKEDVVLAAISEQTEFPGGSFTLERGSLLQGNPDAAPKNYSVLDLKQWGVTVS